jgi:hypothetical protein
MKGRLTRGEAFALLQQGKGHWDAARRQRQRADAERAKARALALQVHDSEAWKEIEDPETCKQDKHGRPQPGTGKGYANFAWCLANEWHISRFHAYRILKTARIERDFPLENPLPAAFLRVLHDLDKHVRQRTLEALRTTMPDIDEFEDAQDFRSWINGLWDAEALDELEYSSLTPEQKIDMITRSRARQEQLRKETAAIAFNDFWWRRVGQLEKTFAAAGSDRYGNESLRQARVHLAAAKELIEAVVGPRPEKAKKAKVG